MHNEQEEVKYDRKKWRCTQCHFDNYHQLNVCEICQMQRPILKQQSLMVSEKSAVIQCQNNKCKADNPLDVDFCVICAHPLFEEKQPPKLVSEKHRINKDLIKCMHCQFQNHNSNLKCLNCEKFLKPPKVKPLSFGLFGAHQNQCEYCGSNLKLAGPNMHFGGVPSFDICECQLVDTTTTIVCSFCDQKVRKDDRSFHADTCHERQIFFDKKNNPSFDRCTDLQIETILYMHRKYEPIHFKYQSKVLARVRKLGYTEEDLQNLHHYITNYAPIIVHMRANSHFQFFVKDTHYRNAFQVSKAGPGGIGGRNQWEDRMFDKKHHRASNFQRVKYGTMNFTNDPKGVAVCSGYGQSYFLLKSHVRNRCTITDMDSAGPNSTIGTFRFINNVLSKLSDNELKAAFQGSKGKQMQSNVIGAYKQIQIHGPIQFAKDIQRVYICKSQLQHAPGILKMVKQFCQKYNLEYETFDVRSQVVHYGVSNFKAVQSEPNRFIKEGIKEEEIRSNRDEQIYFPGRKKARRR